jgi:hypothetical protein
MEEPPFVSTMQTTWNAKRGRPRLMLSEEQASRLERHTADLTIKHADNPRHAEFVLDFVRVVYQVTGQTFSAGIYRKLLRAFVAQRSPSTVTIEAQKQALRREIVQQCSLLPLISKDSYQSDQPRSSPPVCETYSVIIEMLSMLHLMSGDVARLKATPNESRQGLEAYNQDLSQLVTLKEAELASARAEASEASARAQQASTRAAERAEQLATAQQAVATVSESVIRTIEQMEWLRLNTSSALDRERRELKALREELANLEVLYDDRMRELRRYFQIVITQ